MKEAIDTAVKKEMVDTKESIMTLLKIAGDDADDNLLNGLFEAFSMMKEIHNLEDFDNWAKQTSLQTRIYTKRKVEVK